jgi:hypothetical protein
LKSVSSRGLSFLGTGINYVGLDLENREIVELQMLNHAVLLEIL